MLDKQKRQGIPSELRYIDQFLQEDQEREIGIDQSGKSRNRPLLNLAQ